jgi:hypothetical protein
MTRPANLREEMPTVTAWIDDLRAAFGADGINAQIKKGMAGLPGFFHARENGHDVGTPMPADNPAKVVSVATMVSIICTLPMRAPLRICVLR